MVNSFFGHLVTENRHLISDLKLTHYCWNWLTTVEIDSLLLKLTLYCWNWLYTVEIDSKLLKLTLLLKLTTVEIDSTVEMD